MSFYGIFGGFIRPFFPLPFPLVCLGHSISFSYGCGPYPRDEPGKGEGGNEERESEEPVVFCVSYTGSSLSLSYIRPPTKTLAHGPGNGAHKVILAASYGRGDTAPHPLLTQYSYFLIVLYGVYAGQSGLIKRFYRIYR